MLFWIVLISSAAVGLLLATAIYKPRAMWDSIVRFWHWLFKIPSAAATAVGLIITLTLSAFGYMDSGWWRPGNRQDVSVVTVVNKQREIDDLKTRLDKAHHKIAELEAEISHVKSNGTTQRK